MSKGDFGLRRDRGGNPEEASPPPHAGWGNALGAATGRSPFGPGAETIAALCASGIGTSECKIGASVGKPGLDGRGGSSDGRPEREGSSEFEGSKQQQSPSASASSAGNARDDAGNIFGNMTFATSIRQSSAMSLLSAADRSCTAPKPGGQVNTTSRDILGSMALRRSSGLSRGSGNLSFATGTYTTSTSNDLTKNVSEHMTCASSIKPSSVNNDLLGRKVSSQTASPALAAGGSITGNVGDVGNDGAISTNMAFKPSSRRLSPFHGSPLRHSYPGSGGQVNPHNTGDEVPPNMTFNPSRRRRRPSSFHYSPLRHSCPGPADQVNARTTGDYVPREMAFAASLRQSAPSHGNMGSPDFVAGQGNSSSSVLAARGQFNSSFASSVRRSSGLSYGSIRNARKGTNERSMLPSWSTNSLAGRGLTGVPSLSSSFNSASSASSGFPASRSSFSSAAASSAPRSSTLSVRARESDWPAPNNGPPLGCRTPKPIVARDASASAEEDSDDEIGAIIYQSSRVAKVRASQGIGRGPSARDEFSSARAGRGASAHSALSKEAYAASIERSFDILRNRMDLIRARDRADDFETLFFGAGTNANSEWDREAVDGLADFANKFIVQPSEIKKRQALSKKRQDP